MATSSSEIIERIETLAIEKWLGFPLLVAVSGGADSVALLRILMEFRHRHELADCPLIVVHVNHATRGEASNQDERFVSQLAESHKLEFRLSRLDHDREKSLSEEAMREARYQTLIRIAKQVDARYIATGHTCDDQVETVLFRIFRGTGITGLSGIPPIRVVDQSISIVRPLLQFTRVEILSYLKSIGQDYRTDLSNSEARFSRNFLRHEILPLIRDRFGPTVDKSVLRLADQSQEYQRFLDQAASSLDGAVMEKSRRQLTLSVPHLQQHPPILIRHFIIRCWCELDWPRQAMTSKWWSEISTSILHENSEKIVLNLPARIRFSLANGIATFTRQS